MNEFQILDAEGKAIAIKVLDAEAAAFWGKEVDTKYYADPEPPQKEGESNLDYLRRSMSANWFDIIGYAIANQGYYTSGWRNVVHYFFTTSVPSKFIKGDKNEPIPITKLRKCIEVKEDGTQVNAWHLEDDIEESIFGSCLFYEPFIELINHWMAKGYTPKQIKN